MTLIRRLNGLLLKSSTVDQQFQLLADYSRLTACLIRENDRLTDENRELKLEHVREMRGLIGGWLIHTESPEIDMRPDLAELDRSLADQIAMLEEHVCD